MTNVKQFYGALQMTIKLRLVADKKQMKVWGVDGKIQMLGTKFMNYD